MEVKHEEPIFEDFEPLVQTWEEDGCSILAIHLPGFSKKQIRVQVCSTKYLKIWGEQSCQRFSKKFQIPPNCDTNNITVKYRLDTLRVRQPLLAESKPLTLAPPVTRRVGAKKMKFKRTKKKSMRGSGRRYVKHSFYDESLARLRAILVAGSIWVQSWLNPRHSVY